MKLKVFTLIYDPARGGFDDQAVAEFLADKEALSVWEHFFVQDQTPVWALLVSYRALERAELRRAAEDPKTDWRGTLDLVGQGVFDAVRRWRNEKARKEGKPPYILLTNRQLADVARLRPDTREALGLVEGIGEARLKDFGAELLKVVKAAAQGTAAAPEGQPAIPSETAPEPRT